MTDIVEATNPAAETTAANPPPPQQPKSILVTRLLRRSKGATVTEIQTATTWQPHSVRAFLSGLRKKGGTLTKEQRKSGETAYRLTSENTTARLDVSNEPA